MAFSLYGYTTFSMYQRGTNRILPGAGPEPLVEAVVPGWVLGPVALEDDGVLPDVKVAEVLSGEGQQEDGRRGNPFSDHLRVLLELRIRSLRPH